MSKWEPVYLETHRRGLLEQKIATAYDILNNCNLCPRNCLVDRHHGERGLCRTGDLPVTSSFGPHFGEEDPLVGRHGSGTIFFTHCNLYCTFCQNYEISHGGEGEDGERTFVVAGFRGRARSQQYGPSPNSPPPRRPPVRRAVGVGVEYRLQDRLQVASGNFLGNAVRNRRNAQRTRANVGRGNLTRPPGPGLGRCVYCDDVIREFHRTPFGALHRIKG